MVIRVVLLLVCCGASLSCLQDTRIRQYFMIKTCRRSEAHLIGRTTVKSLKDCVAYARETDSMAFNYAPRETMRKRRRRPFANCHALSCPELNDFKSLINDSNFDYYSAYGNTTVLKNATCIKSIGVFRLMREKRTFADALDHCQAIFGDLAHVVSEARTNALANLLIPMQDWYKAAFVGLDDRNIEGRYETPLGDPITCFRYRAWSPGHPRNALRSDDCVVLDIEKTWKVVNCNAELASLCELYPTPPNQPSNQYLNIDCSELGKSRERRQCKESKRRQRNDRPTRIRCLKYP